MATFQPMIILNVACRTLEEKESLFSGCGYENPVVRYHRGVLKECAAGQDEVL